MHSKQWVFQTSLALALGIAVFGTSVNGQALSAGTPPMAGNPSPDQVSLDPTTIPKFAHQLPIPRVFAPKVITQNGKVGT